MAALFVDIDGTVVEFHTNTWLPGVREKLIALSKNDHQIIFITMRGFGDQTVEWSEDKTQALLSGLPFSYQLLTSIQSPRYIIDDSEGGFMKVETNDPSWTEKLA